MIRVKLTSTGRLLEDLSGYLTSFQESVNATQAAVTEQVVPTLIDELQPTQSASPWSLNNPTPWTSAAQGKAFHASGGFGGGIPHPRGDMAGSWIVTNDGNGHTVVANPSPGALYAYGSLAKTNPGLHQQLFLLLGGWPTAYPTVKFWMDAIAEETFQRIDDQFKGLASVTSRTRAYSRR